jgi:S1-C subfamily serine protease
MNNKSKSFRIWTAVAVLALAILACGPTPAVVTQSPAPSPTPFTGNNNNNNNQNDNSTTPRSRLISATVQIFGVEIQGGDIKPIYVGSGSIISSDGLILTNAHVASPAAKGEPEAEPDALVIGIVKSEDQPPVYSYRAEVKAVDGYMDLAVIQIYATLKGEQLDPSSLNLPYVPLGNSDNLHVGDPINIYGFPAIGGNTITFTSGNVAGFTAEENLGDRAWIKTDATISGGNSGGMSTNAQGQLIGVPTIAASGADTEATDCRVIQDTNGDGQINNQDTCIPIGGFINALRPINLAMPLIQAAQGGLAYTSPFGSQAGPVNQQGSGGEQVSDISWFMVDSQGNMGDQVNAYPSGVTDMLATFQFRGFTNGEPWQAIWSSGGKTIYSGDYTWSKGSQGTYGVSLGTQGDPFPDGSYHLEVFAGKNSGPLSQSDVVVGKATGKPQPPSGGGVQISGTITDKNSGNPIAGAYVIVLKSGISFDEFSNAGYPTEDMLTYAKTDSNGEYSLPMKIQRNTPYTLIASAEGYIDSYGDDLVWNDSDPANYIMDISLGQ